MGEPCKEGGNNITVYHSGSVEFHFNNLERECCYTLERTPSITQNHFDLPPTVHLMQSKKITVFNVLFGVDFNFARRMGIKYNMRSEKSELTVTK